MPNMHSIKFAVYLLLITYQANSNIIPPNVLIEGCIDLTCLKLLSVNAHKVSVCFEPLRKQVANTKDAGNEICCNVRQYQGCIFPLVIAHCGLDSMDKFEEEMRSINNICNLVTLSWTKCEPKNITTTQLDIQET